MVGGICLHGIPLAMLMRDPSYLNGRKEMAPLVSNQQSERAPLVSSQQSEVASLVSNQQSEMVPLDSETQKGESWTLESCENLAQAEDAPLIDNQEHKQSSCSLISDKFGLHLLKNWMFVMFMISYATILLCHMSLHWFIPHRAVEIGLSTHDAAMAVTVVNFANIFSRVLFGTAISDKLFNQIIILTSYVFISGLTTILAIFCTTYWSYMVFSALFGILRGLFLMYVLLISVHLVGKSQVDLALGLIFTLAGLVFLVSIPMFGYFNEKTDSYTITFVLYGIIELLGGLFLVTIPIYLRAKKL